MSGQGWREGSSPAFRLLVLVVALAACAGVSPARPIGLGIMSVVVMVLAASARVRVGVIVRRWLPLGWFVAGAAGVMLVAARTEGGPTVRVPIVGATIPESGARFLGALTAKSVLIVTTASTWARWMSERDVLAGLTGLRVPGRIAAVLYLMLRNLRDVRDEATRLVRARDARGRPRGWRAVKVAAALSRVLLIRLGQRADLRAAALVSRGFGGRLPLVGWGRLSPREVGWVVLSGLGVAVVSRL